MEIRKLLIILLMIIYACSDKTASIQELNKTFTTYGFSDADLVPKPDRNYYPYFRYDGYAKESEPEEWKVIEMENPYVKVHIFTAGAVL